MTYGHPGMPNSLGFAPQRRGGLNSYEICFADQKRMQGVSWQNIANMLGRYVADVRGACDPKFLDRDEPPTADPVIPATPAEPKRRAYRMIDVRGPMSARWTEGQDLLAKTKWQAGDNVQLIADAVGKPRAAVISRAWRRGWGKHPNARDWKGVRP